MPEYFTEDEEEDLKGDFWAYQNVSECSLFAISTSIYQ